MSITYNNPDEVVKVKHILSLAEHIAEKIDGSSSSSGSDSSSSTTSKTTPTFSASVTQWSAATFSNETGPLRAVTTSALTYNGDGDFFVSSQAIQDGLGVEVWKISNKISFRPFYYNSLQPAFPYTFKVGFTETDNYKSCSVDITITD